MLFCNNFFFCAFPLFMPVCDKRSASQILKASSLRTMRHMLLCAVRGSRNRGAKSGVDVGAPCRSARTVARACVCTYVRTCMLMYRIVSRLPPPTYVRSYARTYVRTYVRT